MTDVAILVPTRGRPERFAAMAKAVRLLSETSVEIWAGVDDDDPSDYFNAVRDSGASPIIIAHRGTRRTLQEWTNTLAQFALHPGGNRPPARYLVSMGDDHIPRKIGWDRILCDAIDALPGGVGFAYGNDLCQGFALPTAWMMSTSAYHALGWVMLPALDHMYVDNAVRALGTAAGCIAYCPAAVVEHMHPVAGKAPWDDSYRLSNAKDHVERDRKAYDVWLNGPGIERDAAALMSMARTMAARQEV